MSKLTDYSNQIDKDLLKMLYPKKHISELVVECEPYSFDELNTVSNYKEMFMQDFINSAFKQYNEKLETYILLNLTKHGYSFKHRVDFLEFCQSKIQRVIHENYPNMSYFYVNYFNKDNMGLLIGCVDTSCQIKEENGSIIINIG
jgi:tRNA(Ile)-lysidine synthase TilS/MesJ